VLRAVDELWFRLERLGVVAGFLVMSAVVFADVVHRVFSDAAWQTPSRLAVVAAVALLLAVGAVRSATGGKTPWARAALYASGVVILAAAVAFGFVRLWPSGLVWAQTLALVLMIWVAFLGASIATRQGRHLKVDAAERLFKGTAKRSVSATANALAALATLALGVLAVRFCQYHYGIYVETEGLGGDFEGLPIPRFIAYAVLPLSLFTMSLRFLGHAVNAAQGRFLQVELSPGLAAPADVPADVPAGGVR
jgi:TRAP-type C4-dicarboxylate transport system permease small subunit